MAEVGCAERQDISPVLAQAASDRLGDYRQVARVSHHDPSAFHPVRLVSEPLVLTYLGNRDLPGGSPCEPVQRVNGRTSNHAVVRETHILLELLDRLVGPGTMDAVDPVRVETELAETALEFRHVVAPHHRVAVVEKPITETVVGLHESVPGLRTADSVNHQAPVALKAAQRSLGLGAEFLRVPVDAVTNQSKSVL